MMLVRLLVLIPLIVLAVGAMFVMHAAANRC